MSDLRSPLDFSHVSPQAESSALMVIDLRQQASHKILC